MPKLPSIPKVDVALMGLVLVGAGVFLVRQLSITSPGMPTFEYPKHGSLVVDAALRAEGDVTSSTTLHALLQDTGGQCVGLLFFSPECGYCKQIAPSWSGVPTLELAGGEVPVFWIAVDSENEANGEFIAAHDLRAPWYAIPDLQELARIGVDRWPLIYVIDADGAYRGTTENRVPTAVVAEFEQLCG